MKPKCSVWCLYLNFRATLSVLSECSRWCSWVTPAWVRPPSSSTTARDTSTIKWALLSVSFSFIITVFAAINVHLGGYVSKVWNHVGSRYRFPDEDCNCGLHHHHHAALGHRRTGEVRWNTAHSDLSQPCVFHVAGKHLWPFVLPNHRKSFYFIQISKHHWAILSQSWRYPRHVWPHSLRLLHRCERMDALCKGEQVEMEKHAKQFVPI